MIGKGKGCESSGCIVILFFFVASVSKKRHSDISELDIKAMEVDPIDYDYPFENIVFEGGGLKGVAFCGSIQVRFPSSMVLLNEC